MPLKNTQNYKGFALGFVESLTQRQYTTAYAMTAYNYQTKISLKQLQQAFEDIVPLDWITIIHIFLGITRK